MRRIDVIIVVVLAIIAFAMFSCVYTTNVPLIVTQVSTIDNIGTPQQYLVRLNHDVTIRTTTNYKVGDTLK